jgi:uncharacterized oxidoreductase
MKITNNTILITGGATGIGFAIAEALIQVGNQVIICGRREHKLLEAQIKIPQLQIKVCDLENRAERESLRDWATSQFPNLNILINNAGIQKEIDFTIRESKLWEGGSEITINLEASIHLTALFIPHFLKQNQDCAIVNISSGLAFIPLKIYPVYCATKAALHSFSISLRTQLEKTNVKVFEIIPPIVNTELDKGVRQKRSDRQKGISVSVVAQSTLAGLRNNDYEVTIGIANLLKFGSRIAPKFFHKILNKKITT